MLPIISLDGLIVLDAIDKKGSFSAAAESLFRVPSALTYTVQKLESDLGVKLFERKGQRAELTLVGQLVLRQGREILAATSRLEEAVRQLETGWESSLTLAIDTVVPDLPLLQLVCEFTELGKQVTLNLSEESLGGGWDALYSGRADIAIGVTGELPKGQYHLVEIGQLEFVFALSPSHPLAQYGAPIPTEALLQFPSIVVADSSMALAQRSSGLFDSRQVIRVPNMQTKIKAQQLGLGVGYIPKHLILDALASGALVVCEVEISRPPQAVFLAWRKGSQGKALTWFAERLPHCDWQF
ncbi:LysR substrate-binding domain-containing protein [Shewanella sp. HN-41]|uniref:LysR substrate-binding domain-containing protein n=1 Tax=Shewanella sp. HN-41 TaxID=327275 RepID=UPI000212636B|nr:LysR substrate-binding domain-containing protein [Shewanella sp. HN-41]EGM71346.1 transcriptional regulator, LysR family [Shewanella sp. HN-41]